MKTFSPQLQNFVSSFNNKHQPKAELETVESFISKTLISDNHEIWRTCNVCDDEFDVKKEKEFVCPTCGSTDLRFSYKNELQKLTL